jgi:hypothetical protein
MRIATIKRNAPMRSAKAVLKKDIYGSVANAIAQYRARWILALDGSLSIVDTDVVGSVTLQIPQNSPIRSKSFYDGEIVKA